VRAVAGSLLVLAAVVLVAAVLLASRLAPRSAPDGGVVDFVLVVGALALGLFGLVVLVGGLADRPRPADRPPSTG